MDISQVGISARRRHVTAVIAIDTSMSMSCRQRGSSKTRLQAASQGASKVIDSLHEDDHVAILGFGSDVQNVSDGIVALNPSCKATLQRKLNSLRPNGMTALYDTIFLGCMMVLEFSSQAKQIGSLVDADLGTFWLVVLTDGDDTKSKASHSDAVDILRKINSVLGSAAMKVVFIGVSLGSSERRNLEALVRAGGEMATFKEAHNIKEIESIFDEISVQIQVTQVRVRPTNPLEQLAEAVQALAIQQGSEDDSPSWDGPVKKGSHVRCVGQSRGSGSVSIGDIGVVKSRDPDGDYRVNFQLQDNWAGSSSDIVLDSTAEKVRPGAIVTLKSSVSSPRYGWGDFKRGMQGLVHKVSYDGDVYVQFGFDPNGKSFENLWKSQLADLEAKNCSGTDGPWPGHLQPGQAVRVPLRLNSPSTGWGSLNRGEIGYVRATGTLGGTTVYVCDFPSINSWKGRPEDLEVEAVANLIRPGKKVRVREGIVPSRGWAGVSSSSVGTVVSISYDGKPVVVNFPEHHQWNGALNELETIDRPKSERATVISTSGVKDCAGRHGLDPKNTEHAGMQCDFCGRVGIPAGARMFGCRKCDTDACERCYDDTTRKFGINAAAVLRGLNSQAGAPLNGRMARVTSYRGDDRYNMQLIDDTTKAIAVRESNMMVPMQKHSDGARIVLQNMLSQPDLNGRHGIVKGFNSKSGLYTIECNSSDADSAKGGMRGETAVEAFPMMLEAVPSKTAPRLGMAPNDPSRTDSQPAKGIDAALGGAFTSKGEKNIDDFVGENMSVRDMKTYLTAKGVSIAGAVEKNDLRKLVWDTQVSELGGGELDAFMQKQGIDFSATWSVKAKREAAEAGYEALERHHYSGEIPIAVAVPMPSSSAGETAPLPSAPPQPTEVPQDPLMPQDMDIPVAPSAVFASPATAPATEFTKGDLVKLVGLKQESMNGMMGVIETGKVTGGRLEVQLVDNTAKTKWVKTENVELIEDMLD